MQKYVYISILPRYDSEAFIIKGLEAYGDFNSTKVRLRVDVAVRDGVIDGAFQFH